VLIITGDEAMNAGIFMQGRCCEQKDRHLPTVVMDNFIRRLISPPEKKIRKFVSSGIVAADFGCGPGYFTVPMAEMIGPAGKVYAVDSDLRSIQTVRRKAQTRGLENIIETHVASAADANYIPSASVDFIFANGLLCCMTDHKGAVSEIKRILKPTGTAYLSVAKLPRRNDSRAVPKEEWHQILTGFRIIERRDGLLNRWAVVSKASPGSYSTLCNI